jgi:hypothetical protein
LATRTTVNFQNVSTSSAQTTCSAGFTENTFRPLA